MTEEPNRIKTFFHDAWKLFLRVLNAWKKINSEIAYRLVIRPVLSLINETIGKQVVRPVLVKALKSKSTGIRKNAAFSLGDFGLVKGDNRAITALIGAALGDNAWEVRREATRSLAGVNNFRAIAALVRALGDDNNSVAFWASQSLITTGKSAVRALMGALKNDNPMVQFRAAHSLGKIGDVDLEEVRSALRKFIERKMDKKSAMKDAAECYHELCITLGGKREKINMPGEVIQAKLRPPKGRVFRRRVAHA